MCAHAIYLINIHIARDKKQTNKNSHTWTCTVMYMDACDHMRRQNVSTERGDNHFPQANVFEVMMRQKPSGGRCYK